MKVSFSCTRTELFNFILIFLSSFKYFTSGALLILNGSNLSVDMPTDLKKAYIIQLLLLGHLLVLPN